jgi:hypothetical protein
MSSFWIARDTLEWVGAVTGNRPECHLTRRDAHCEVIRRLLGPVGLSRRVDLVWSGSQLVCKTTEPACSHVSLRRACMGSTDAALLAGNTVAMVPNDKRITGPRASIQGS